MKREGGERKGEREREGKRERERERERMKVRQYALTSHVIAFFFAGRFSVRVLSPPVVVMSRSPASEDDEEEEGEEKEEEEDVSAPPTSSSTSCTYWFTASPWVRYKLNYHYLFTLIQSHWSLISTTWQTWSTCDGRWTHLHISIHVLLYMINSEW